jgi:hypothetical protein
MAVKSAVIIRVSQRERERQREREKEGTVKKENVALLGAISPFSEFYRISENVFIDSEVTQRYVNMIPEAYLSLSHRHEALRVCSETDSNMNWSGCSLQLKSFCFTTLRTCVLLRLIPS